MIFPKIALLTLMCVSVALAGAGDSESQLRQLGVDAQGVEALVAHMEAQGVSRDTQEVHLNRLVSLAHAGLPVAPVLNRYLEGFAKGIPLSRIEGVVQSLAHRLEEAARAVDEASSRAEVTLTPQERLEAIDHTAYAMGAGVGGEYLGQSLDMACLSRREGYGLNAPLVTMSVLVSAGVAPDRSYNVLHTAWDRGLRGRELERLGRALAGFDESGEAAEIVVDLLVADQSLDSVFQNLENLQGAPKNGFTPGEIHDPPSGKRVLPRKDKDPNPVSPRPVAGRG